MTCPISLVPAALFEARFFKVTFSNVEVITELIAAVWHRNQEQHSSCQCYPLEPGIHNGMIQPSHLEGREVWTPAGSTEWRFILDTQTPWDAAYSEDANRTVCIYTQQMHESTGDTVDGDADGEQ